MSDMIVFHLTALILVHGAVRCPTLSVMLVPIRVAPRAHVCFPFRENYGKSFHLRSSTVWNERSARMRL